MISWAENVSARRAAGVKSGNSLGPLTAAFLRIVAVGAFDVTRGTDDELGRVMTALCGIDVCRSRISNARRRGRKPEEMRECFGAIPATDEGFIRRLYRTRPEVLRRVLMPLLARQSAANALNHCAPSCPICNFERHARAMQRSRTVLLTSSGGS